MGRELTLAAGANDATAMRRAATGLLLLMAVVFLCAQHYEKVMPAIGPVRAFAEAAVIGALADWFAVTALFRHPLGIPIPHTAIVARNKDRIGDNLGRFVEENFLAPQLVAARIARVDFAGRMAKWLAEPAQAAWLAGGLTSVLPKVLGALDDTDLRRFARAHLSAGARRIDVAPLAGEILELLTRNDRHQELLTQLIEQLPGLLEEYKPQIRERVKQEVWWGLRTVALDEIVYQKFIDALERFLEELRTTPTHELRQRFDRAVRRLIGDLKSSPEYQARGEALRERLLENPALHGYVASLWDEIRDRILEDAASASSAIRAQFQSSIANLGLALLGDLAMQDKLNGWVRAEIVEQVAAHGHHVAKLISDTVRRWDAETVTQKVEAEVGRDLQYIRINGTLIGGLAGLALYALSALL